MLRLLLGVCALGVVQATTDKGSNPVQKIIELLSGMQSKWIKEGTAEQKTFEELQRWCERQSIDKHHSIKNLQREITSAQAGIDTSDSIMAQQKATIEKLAGQIAWQEKELAEAEKIRKGEAALFEKEDKILAETIDTLMRAIVVLKKHMKGGAFLQAKSKQNKHLVAVQEALSAVVRASFVSLEDKSLIQNLLSEEKEKAEKASDAFDFLDTTSLGGQPQATTSNYDNKSGGIIETFESVKEKAQAARSQGQKDEMKKKSDYTLLKQTTELEISQLKKEMTSAKTQTARAWETKAAAESELAKAQKALAADQKYLDDTQRKCMDSATNFEKAQKERAAELNVLAQAKEILSSAAFVQTSSTTNSDTSVDAASADSNSDDALAASMGFSFLQVSSRQTVKQSILSQRENDAANYLRQEGKRMNSWILTQIGSKIGMGDSPFAKVSRMIQDMIAKLEKEMSAEADQHAWCTTENAKTDKALKEKSTRFDDLTTRKDQSVSRIAKLKQDISNLQTELVAMQKSVAKATQIRQEEHTEFLKVQKELENAQSACARAIKVLKDYYSQGSSDSSLLQTDQPAGTAASSVIGFLETAEADFSRSVAEAKTAEDTSQSEYEKLMQDTKVSTAAKEAEVKGKTSQVKASENVLAETTSDLDEAGKELEAVKAYKEKLKKNCETKAPSFEERQKRRKDEMEGLKNALDILNGNGVALLQQQADSADALLSGLN